MLDKPCQVSIIIPTYHDWGRLELCIEAIKSQSYPRHLLEVIIVNNDPQDNPPKTIKIGSNIKLINESKPGSYAARNTALQNISGEIIAFTDSDCIPDIDWIANAVAYFDNNPNVTRIAGNVRLFYKSPKPNFVELYDSVFSFRQKMYAEVYKFGVTANMITKASLLKEVGIFNGQLMSGGDFEWGKRATNANSIIHFVENVIVLHPARYDIHDLRKKAKRVTGGHSNMSNSKSFRNMFWPFLKGFKPSLSEWGMVNKGEMSFAEKLVVFAIRYNLQVLSNVEKIKIAFGHKPERL